MPDVRLVPMPESRFATWRAHQVVAYAADKVASGAWPEADAERLSNEAFATLLPDGPGTRDHRLFQGRDPDGVEVGTIWLHLDRSRPDRVTGFVYDIEVDPDRRGQGWGRALLTAGEQWCAESGASELGLHVFAHNAVALQLYESAGYEFTDYSMRKQLS